MDLSEYVNVQEAAKLINRKASLIRTLCQQGRFSGLTKIGKSWLIPREEILKYKPAKRGVKPREPDDRTVLENAVNEAKKWEGVDNNE